MTLQLDDFTAPEGEVCYTDLESILKTLVDDAVARGVCCLLYTSSWCVRPAAADFLPFSFSYTAKGSLSGFPGGEPAVFGPITGCGG